MTRPRVPPDQRQRTAHACESCKRRKQKCNGLIPCNTCSKRHFECIYNDRDTSSPVERPSKKRYFDDGPNQPVQPMHSVSPIVSDLSSRQFPASPGFQTPFPHSTASNPPAPPSVTFGALQSVEESPAHYKLSLSRSQPSFGFPRYKSDDRTKSFLSIVTGLSGNEGEAVVYGQARMLQDATGRLLYIGDSATLSFLQLLRMMVEPIVGHCPFTDDPRRHMITESTFTLSSTARLNTLLPDRKTAGVLAESFFVNTHGLVHVFDRDSFFTALDATYDDPLNVDSAWLCQLNLVFAIGLMLASPKPASEEAMIISKLEQHADQAEVFYLNAKNLNDPWTGFEDADFWSIQALLLMSVYMLTKSKRNTAFALLGMAVRSAYALGLHREDTLVIFHPKEQAARRNLWKSLFVMDRYMALSLGRPSAIVHNELYTGPSAKPPVNGTDRSAYSDTLSFDQSATFAMDAAVMSCSVIGRILRDVYQQRKISTRVAQEIAQICKEIPGKVAPFLKWPKPLPPDRSRSMAILHVNLLYIHSVVLLTRPFFIYVFNLEMQRKLYPTGPLPMRRGFRRIEKFSEACVSAATHAVQLCQGAFKSGCLARRNPWVIYFLSSSALVLVANAFTSMHPHPAAEQCIKDAMNILTYCGLHDSQAERMFYILQMFRAIVDEEREKNHRNDDSRELAPFQPKAQNVESVPPLAPPVTLNGTDAIILPTPQADLHVQSAFNQAFANGAFNHQQNVEVLGPPPPPGFTSGSSATATNPAPMEPLPPPSCPPNPLTPEAGGRPVPLPTAGAGPMPLPYDPSNPAVPFTSLLEFTSFGADGVYQSDDGSGPDDNIDFDAFWTLNGAHGGGVGMGSEERMGVADGMVPLYGVLDG